MSLFNNFSFAGKKALIRVDFNVPLNDAFEITDDNRMRATIPTITKILKDGGSVILMSHLGRPKEGPTEKYSLQHIVKHLSELLGGVHVGFANDWRKYPDAHEIDYEKSQFSALGLSLSHYRQLELT